MMSEKVLRWFKKNSPAEEPLENYGEIHDLARKAGISFEKKDNRFIFVIGDRPPKKFFGGRNQTPAHYYYEEFLRPPIVAWRYMVRGGGEMVFYPYLRGGTGVASGIHRSSPSELLIKAAGVGEVVVKLPERVISLPTPEWAYGVNDCGLAAVESTLCFLSEAEEMAKKFAGELLKAVGGIHPRIR
jgi:hypothetical protein